MSSKLQGNWWGFVCIAGLVSGCAIPEHELTPYDASTQSPDAEPNDGPLPDRSADARPTIDGPSTSDAADAQSASDSPSAIDGSHTNEAGSSPDVSDGPSAIDGPRDEDGDRGVDEAGSSHDASDADALLSDVRSTDGEVGDVRTEDGPADACAPRNACGGCAMLTSQPGASCGPCNDGMFVCNGPDAVVCMGARSTNPCGGCTTLSAMPGTVCGCRGTVVCNGQEATQCTTATCLATQTCTTSGCLLNDEQPCTQPSACASGSCLMGLGADADNDGFGDKSGSGYAFCTRAPAGYVTNRLDCCDRDGDVRPTQTIFRWQQSSCGGFDWNCDGVEELQYPDRFTCDPVVDGWSSTVAACSIVGDWVHVAMGAPTCGISLASMQQQCR